MKDTFSDPHAGHVYAPRKMVLHWRLEKPVVRCVELSGLTSHKMRKRAEMVGTVASKRNHLGSRKEVVKHLLKVLVHEYVLPVNTGGKAVHAIVS